MFKHHSKCLPVVTTRFCTKSFENVSGYKNYEILGISKNNRALARALTVRLLIFENLSNQPPPPPSVIHQTAIIIPGNMFLKNFHVDIAARWNLRLLLIGTWKSPPREGHDANASLTPGNVCALQLRVCSTVEDIQYNGGGISSVRWRIFRTDCTVLMISLHCTDDIPPLYWISSIVLRISLHRTDDILPLYWISSTVLYTLHWTAHTLPGDVSVTTNGRCEN